MNQYTSLDSGFDPPQQSAVSSEESTWNKVSREAYVVVGGIKDSFQKNVQNIFENPGETAPAFLASAGIGAGLAFLQGRKGMLKLAGQAIGLGFGAAFVKDIADPVRFNEISESLGNTWNSRENLAANRAQFARSGGQFVFDTALMGGGGILGAGAVKAGSAGGLFRSVGEKPAGLGVEKHSMELGFSNPVVAERRFPELEFFTADKSPSKGARMLSEADLAKPAQVLIAEQTIKWDNSGMLEWKPTKESLQMRREAQDFVQHTMQGDFVKAIDGRLQSEVMRGIELNPPSRVSEVKTTAAELTQAENLPMVLHSMSEKAVFRWDQSLVNGLVEGETLKVVVPRLVVSTSEGNVPVALFDFAKADHGYKIVFPEKSTGGATLSAGQLAEIEAIRASSIGKRVLGETAIFAFEETFHAAQRSNGGKPITPSAAEDLKLAGLTNNNRYFKQAFVGMLDQRLPLRTTLYEREIPGALFDAGMPFEMVKRHFFFEPRHTQERAPIMELLRKLDQGEL